MSLSVEFVFRMIGMVVVGILGWSFGSWAARIEPFDPRQVMLYRVVFGLVGALAGLVLTPYVTTRPSRWRRRNQAEAACGVPPTAWKSRFTSARPNDSGSKVRHIQIALNNWAKANELGFNIDEDGKWEQGSAMTRRVREFQDAMDLEETGRVDGLTAAYLFRFNQPRYWEQD